MVAWLLKYANHSRFLDGGLFRFSQPAALNDPHEAIPDTRYEEYSAEDLASVRVDYDPFHPLSVEKEQRLREMLLGPSSRFRLDEKMSPTLWPLHEPRLRDEPFNTLAEVDRCIADLAQSLLVACANSRFGIFSLTRADAEHMWAYYAQGHAGLCVRFNAEHKCFANAQPVQYSDHPIFVSTKLGLMRVAGIQFDRDAILNRQISTVPALMLLRKRASWAHEEEVRILADLSKADKVHRGADPSGLPICLFRVPRDAVHSIVFGLRAPQAFIDEAAVRAYSSSEWYNVPMFRREMRGTRIVEVPLVTPKGGSASSE